MAKKSLGQLTLDLVARVAGFEQGLDKASRKSQKTAKQIERYSNQIGLALTAGTAAAVTGMAALVASTAEGARETKNLAALSNATTKEFQRGVYAVRRYGLDTEKYADVLKDVNDRVGDFMQTGAGPMADFFENIAPKVGVTADEFARLSGPEALQLYVNSLEAAGVSQQEMTFYMEAIASDASKLIPLLRDNGKGMAALGDEAERTGNVLSDLEFQQLESVRRGMDELTGAATGMKNEIVLAAIPAIEDLVEMLSDEQTLDSARSLGNAIVESVKFAVDTIDGAVQVTKFLAEELAAAIHGPAADDLPRMQDAIKAARKEMQVLIDEYNRPRLLRGNPFISSEDLAEDVVEARKHLESLEAQYQQALKARQDVSAAAGGSQGTIGGRGTNTPGSGGGSDATVIPPVGGDGEDLDKQLQDRLESIRQAFESEKQTILRIYGERNEEIQSLYEADALSKMEADNLKYQNEQRKIEAITDLTKENLEERTQAEAGYWERWMESASENLQNFDDLSKTVIDNFATGFGNAFESVIFEAETLDDALKGIGETILRSVVNSIGQMAAQWLALQAVQAVVGTTATAATVGQAATASAAWAPAAAMASLATLGGNAVPAATALASTTTLASGLALTGMAHDGIDRVPREGTWLLDGGERVMTSPQADRLDQFLAAQGGGAGGSAPIINVNESPGQGGEIRSRTNQDGQFVIDIMVEQFNSHGPGSKAAQSAFGLKRQGY